MQHITLLVLILSVTGIAIVYIVLGHQSSTSNKGKDKQLDDMARQLKENTKRLENVETVITDKSWRVDQEFENLQNDR